MDISRTKRGSFQSETKSIFPSFESALFRLRNKLAKICIYIFLSGSFLLHKFTIHRAAGEGGSHF